MFEFLKYNPPNTKENFELTFSSKEEETKNEIIQINVSKSIDENLNNIKKLMHLDVNSDIVIRFFN